MKKQIFALAILGFCLCASPAWAMDDDNVATVESDDEANAATQSMNQASKERKNSFFLHIANPDAAVFYKTVVEQYEGLHNWKRKLASTGSIADNENFFNRSTGIQKLCHTVEQMVKDGARQKLIPIGCLDDGLIVELTAPTPETVPDMIRQCEQSEYVYGAFTEESKLMAHIEAHYKNIRCFPAHAHMLQTTLGMVMTMPDIFDDSSQASDGESSDVSSGSALSMGDEAQSDDDLDDKQSKEYLIFVTDYEIAALYNHIARDYNLSINDWKRAVKLIGSSEATEEYFRLCNDAQNLCRAMKSALRKFNATQTLGELTNNGLRIRFRTSGKYSMQEVLDCFKLSDHVYTVFAEDSVEDREWSD